MKKLNLIRQQVIKLRRRNGWTQEDFAVKLQIAGWHNRVFRVLPGFLSRGAGKLLYKHWA